MEHIALPVSADFRRKGTKAMLAIAVFIITYIALIGAVATLTYLGARFTILMLMTVPTLQTVILGIAILLVSLIVCFFMVKFIFSRHKTDRSMLLKITRREEPHLFGMIDEIVAQAGCRFPKNVYVSADVNASVFYNSGFWSMFLPVRKNLVIGAGLVNSVTEDEFKAILAHEFGHFAQKSMRIGSYVYNTNRVLFNLLYDNRSIESLQENLSHFGIVGQGVSFLGIAIIRGIRWVLLQVYTLVNLQYLSLSRDMELQADAFAASVAGGRPVVDSLLRMGLSEYAYNSVLGFYNERMDRNIRTENLYPQHAFVLSFLSEKNGIEQVNGLPCITQERTQQFNKSRLKIDNPWESHPENDIRILALGNVVQEQTASGPASRIFTDFEKTGKAISQRLFNAVPPQGAVELIDLALFQHEFEKDYETNSFDAIFNGYYNAHDLPDESSIKLMAKPPATEIQPETLFTDAITERLQVFQALEQDLAVIVQIAEKKTPIRVFDYDGKRYTRKEARQLAEKLAKQVEEEKVFFEQHDHSIFHVLLQLAKAKDIAFLPAWDSYIGLLEDARKKQETAQTLIKGMEFLQFQLASDEIMRRINNVRPYEKLYKDAVMSMLNDPRYSDHLKIDAKKSFDALLENELQYFYWDAYRQNEIQLLATSLDWMHYSLAQTLYHNKKQLLTVMTKILKG